MGLARSTYYDEPELQPISEARLVEQIKAVCAEWPAYGCRRVTAELHDEGRIVNHKKVSHAADEGKRPDRAAAPALIATTDSNHDGSIFPNIAENLVPTRLNQPLGRRHQCAAGSGVRDGGWSPAIGLQERVANHRKRRWSKAGVVSVTEKALQRRQVGDRKANTREPPFKCRKCSDDVETGE
jgi:hypothetical protein